MITLITGSVIAILTAIGKLIRMYRGNRKTKRLLREEDARVLAEDAQLLKEVHKGLTNHITVDHKEVKLWMEETTKAIDENTKSLEYMGGQVDTLVSRP